MYYESLFKKILFTAKIYLSMLSTYTLYKLVRAPSKRLFYIEVGLDNDDGEAVSSFVRDLKTKELKFNDIATSSINNVLSLVSCFNDLFIPTVDGQKPIEMETAQEDSPNMDSDFSDQLLRNMLSGMSVPHAAVTDSDIQYSRQLAQENLYFMKAVISLQQILGPQFTKLMRTLYANEYPEQLMDNVDKRKNLTDDEHEQVLVNLRYIEVEFPPPTSLLVNVAQEQSGNVTNFAEFIIRALLGENADGSDAQFNIKKQALFKEIVKEYLPNIDWAHFEKIFEKSLIQASKDKVENDADNSPENIDTNGQYSDSGEGF